MAKTSTLLLLLLWFWPGAELFAQAVPGPASQAKAIRTRAQWASPETLPEDVRVSSTHTDAATGLEYVYVQQLHIHVPVHNQVVTLVFSKDRLVYHAGSFVAKKRFAGLAATPALAVSAAVQTAAQPLQQATKRSFSAQPLATTASSKGSYTFAPGELARRPIATDLVWVVDSTRRVHLAWNVSIDVQGTSDWVNTRVDAATGKFIEKDNWTVHEAPRRPRTTAAPAAATASATWFAPLFSRPLAPPSGEAAYLVVPYPHENPNTPLQVETNPWLKAGAGNPAVSLGWHSDGTTAYSDTRGNNVLAYDDAARQNKPGNYAPTRTAGALDFTYIPDFSQHPTAAANRNSAITNLFYWSNIVHDILYQFGFTEAAGNFQTNNQGRGGFAADPVLAEAQDGSGTDNANFNTPPDGLSGRMQMYLWSSAPALQVNAPASIAGAYTSAEATFSTQNRLSSTARVSGELAWFDDAATSDAPTHTACSGSAASPLTGKIALVMRSDCEFTAKVKNAQNSGAKAVILINNVAGGPITMGGTDNTITIPAVMVSQRDGARLAAQLEQGTPVSLSLSATNQLDGDFDNGVIVHEYGHGISSRLTGGPRNSSCLSNAEQAGEGWSDFFALLLTTDWQKAQLTDGPKRRSVGTYAMGQRATAAGLRRYPYSTSLSVNPLTYADVSRNPEVHAIGEVWCAALWDMTWNIIQQQGAVETDLYHGPGNGGNTVALQLVLEGLKLQPCQPGFLDSRNAILMADSLLYKGRYHCAIWQAFARRGMGASAQQGSSTNTADQVAAYDLPGVQLQYSKQPLVGNTFDIALQATCQCQSGTYTISSTLPKGLRYVSSTGGTATDSTVTFAGLAFTPNTAHTLHIRAVVAKDRGCTPDTVVHDNREARTSGGFTSVVTQGTAEWRPSTQWVHSGTTAWAVPDADTPTDVALVSAPFTPGEVSLLSFYHYFSLESTYDGGTVELSADNGRTWQDAGPYFTQNGYNAVFDAATVRSKPPCFSNAPNNTGAFVRSELNLGAFRGKAVQVRFRLRTDASNPAPYLGWFIDDIQVVNGCGGIQTVQLKNSTGELLDSYKQFAFLTPAPAALPVAVSPSTAAACPGSPVALTATVAGSALQFDGAAAYARLPRLVQDDFTLEYWVQTRQTSPTGTQWWQGSGLADANVAGPANDFGTALLNGKLAFGVGGAQDVTIQSTTALNDGSWHHVAVTRQRSTGLLQLYLDGQLEATSAGQAASTSALNASADLLLGALQTKEHYFQGQLEGVRVWRTVRTAAQINNDKNRALPTGTAGLVGLYQFNEATGPALTNEAGSAATAGTLYQVPVRVASTAPLNEGYTFAWASSADLSSATAATVTSTPAATTTYTVTATAESGYTSTATATVLLATAVTWNGSSSSNWFAAANWTPAAVPCANTSVTIAANAAHMPTISGADAEAANVTIADGATLTVASKQTLRLVGNWQNNGAAQFAETATLIFEGDAPTQLLGGTSATSFGRLRVHKSAGVVQLQRNATVGSTLAVAAGQLHTTAAYTLTLGPTATLTETDTDYVVGNLETTRLLSTAEQSEDFGGLGLELTPSGPTLPGSTHVRRITGEAVAEVGGHPSITRHFAVQSAVNKSLRVRLRFSYANHELNGLNTSVLALFRAESGPTGSWTRQLSKPDLRINSFTLADLTTLSAWWTLGSNATPLPTEQPGTTQPAFAVYPTQATHNKPLRYAYAGPALAAGTTLAVYAVDGRCVWQQAGTVAVAGVLPVTGLASGWYAVRLTTPTGHHIARFYQQ